MRPPGAGGVCRDLCRTNPLAPLHAPAHRAAPRHQQISCLAANWIFYFLSKPIDICHHHKTRCSNGQRWTTDGSVSVQSRDIRCNCKVDLIVRRRCKMFVTSFQTQRPPHTHWGFWGILHCGPGMYDFAAISCNF